MNTLIDMATATATAVPVDTTCQQCGQPFTPRTGSGGKPQRFCSAECRQAHHTDKPNVPNVGQRGEAQTTLPVVIPPAAKKSAPAAAPEQKGFWSIPYQAKIEVLETMANDEIEIIQRSPLGDSDDQMISVTLSNAVGLARRIRWAAGFQSVRISTTECDGGGWIDVEDGAEAAQFEFEMRQ